MNICNVMILNIFNKLHQLTVTDFFKGPLIKVLFLKYTFLSETSKTDHYSISGLGLTGIMLLCGIIV